VVAHASDGLSAYACAALRLLLLLLLGFIGSGDGSGFPFTRHRQDVGFRRRRSFRGRYLHRDGQLTLGSSLEDSFGGRHIGVIAADRSANVTVAGDHVISGIEPHPAVARHQRFHPGMSCTFRRTVLLVGARVHITANVAAGNFHMADQRGHDMSKVLADAFARFDSMVDGRIHAGGFGRIFEPLINGDVQLPQERKRIIAAADAEWFNQAQQPLARLREGAGHEHFPIVASRHFCIERIPGFTRERDRQFRGRLDFDQRLGHNAELEMFAGNIEMMDGVAMIIPVHMDPGFWIHEELEREAALLGFGARVHTHFHQAFTDWRSITEPREVADGIKHG
jgi:hypothetical protein